MLYLSILVFIKRVKSLYSLIYLNDSCSASSLQSCPFNIHGDSISPLALHLLCVYLLCKHNFHSLSVHSRIWGHKSLCTPFDVKNVKKCKTNFYDGTVGTLYMLLASARAIKCHDQRDFRQLTANHEPIDKCCRF